MQELIMCGGYSTPESWQQLRIPFSIHEIDQQLVDSNVTKPSSTETLQLFERFPRSGEANNKCLRKYGVRPFDRSPIFFSNTESTNTVESTLASWSLIPSWSKSKQTQFSTFNARHDKLLVSRLWQRPFQNQRCLVPADGFFERVPESGSKKKRPFYIQFRDKRTFLFAGIWDLWVHLDAGESHLSFAIITIPPNALMRQIGHNRMPAILRPDHYESWIAPDFHDEEKLLSIISTPWSSADLEAYPVDYHINYRDRHGPSLIESIGPTVRVD